MIVFFFLELSISIFWWLFLNYWWFENDLDSCQLSLSTKKPNQTMGVCSAAMGAFFCPVFSDATLLAALLQKRTDMFI